MDRPAAPVLSRQTTSVSASRVPRTRSTTGHARSDGSSPRV
ncbi:hypothetical protein Ae406Ps2_0730 [Pseudonocardia sp. Ae406_Ps2]|nr:hypothetical protein Ae406Ps2_0730 [Pseudonocardia sp. Ae406_Ps2]OLM07480.1 hypothetical protein Ae331Ps2_5190c [Pseudonocardia sp. Ae331_Ps2]OLM14670.1 hypothetical protein Ae505Ps2_4800c [Pseudonocardia sp. Ae505_Ps2]OLM22307.1 hypothetical protein Ae706Ps2_0739 [Pseudonocardia sp. Ae706_Ps2]